VLLLVISSRGKRTSADVVTSVRVCDTFNLGAGYRWMCDNTLKIASKAAVAKRMEYSTFGESTGDESDGGGIEV
jgi:hypothetical protein